MEKIIKLLLIILCLSAPVAHADLLRVPRSMDDENTSYILNKNFESLMDEFSPERLRQRIRQVEEVGTGVAISTTAIANLVRDLLVTKQSYWASDINALSDNNLQELNVQGQLEELDEGKLSRLSHPEIYRTMMDDLVMNLIANVGIGRSPEYPLDILRLTPQVRISHPNTSSYYFLEVDAEGEPYWTTEQELIQPTPSYVNTRNDVHLNGAIFVNEQLVLGPDSGDSNIYTSTDAVTWSVGGVRPPSTPTHYYNNYGFTEFNDLFYIVGGGNQGSVSGSSNNVWSSPDLTNWTAVTSLPRSARKTAATTHSGYLYALSFTHGSPYWFMSLYRYDGTSWATVWEDRAADYDTPRVDIRNVAPNLVSFNGDLYSISASGYVRRSTDDGVTWANVRASGGLYTYDTLEIVGDRLFHVQTGGTAIGATDDGVNWTNLTITPTVASRAFFTTTADNYHIYALARVSTTDMPVYRMQTDQSSGISNATVSLLDYLGTVLMRYSQFEDLFYFNRDVRARQDLRTATLEVDGAITNIVGALTDHTVEESDLVEHFDGRTYGLWASSSSYAQHASTADISLDSERLGGELPAYYATATDFTELQSTVAAHIADTDIHFTQTEIAISSSQVSGLEAFLTAETDPFFTASEAFGITSSSTTDWNTAHSWGDHGVAGYADGSSVAGATTTLGGRLDDVESDITDLHASTTTIAGNLSTHTGDATIHFTQSEINISSTQVSGLNVTDWNEAHGWGDHSLAGYADKTEVATDTTTIAGDLSNHISSSTIHFTQADISITESQISDLQSYTTEGSSPTWTGEHTFQKAVTANQYLDDTSNTFISVRSDATNFPTGAGTRMMWIPDKYAFRAGNVTGTQWNTIGDYSVAMGFKTTASEFHSTAMGSNTTASGVASTAMGSDTTASGFITTAMGRRAKSTAEGAFTISDSVDADFENNTIDAFAARFAGGYRLTGGDIDVDSSKIINLADPTSATDAVNRQYGDANYASKSDVATSTGALSGRLDTAEGEITDLHDSTTTIAGNVSDNATQLTQVAVDTTTLETSKLPYTGATADLDMGSFKVTASSLAISGEIDWSGGNVYYVPTDLSLATAYAAISEGDALYLGSGRYTLTAPLVMNKANTGLFLMEDTEIYCDTALAGNRALIEPATNYITISGGKITLIDQTGSNTAIIGGNQAAYRNYTGWKIKNINASISGNSALRFGTFFNVDADIENVIANITTSAGNLIGATIPRGASGTADRIINIKGCTFNMNAVGVGGTSYAFLVYDEGTPTHNVELNVYDSYVNVLNAGTGAGHGVSLLTAGGTVKVYNSVCNAKTYDAYQTAGTLTLYNTTLVNGTTSGTITRAGQINAGSAKFSGTVTAAGFVTASKALETENALEKLSMVRQTPEGGLDHENLPEELKVRMINKEVKYKDKKGKKLDSIDGLEEGDYTEEVIETETLGRCLESSIELNRLAILELLAVVEKQDLRILELERRELQRREKEK